MLAFVFWTFCVILKTETSNFPGVVFSVCMYICTLSCNVIHFWDTGLSGRHCHFPEEGVCTAHKTHTIWVFPCYSSGISSHFPWVILRAPNFQHRRNCWCFWGCLSRRTSCVILSVMCHFGGQLLTVEQLQTPNAEVTHYIDWKKLVIFYASWFVIKTSVQWSCLSQTRCLFQICSEIMVLEITETKCCILFLVSTVYKLKILGVK
jgi:hypothetical protein